MRRQAAPVGGTRVTEAYEVSRELSIVGCFIISGTYGPKERRSDLRTGMEATLGRLAALVDNPA